MHWSYKAPSHAAELTAGFYNVANRDGYAPLVKMLAKQNTGLNFVTIDPSQQESFFNGLISPAGLQWQVAFMLLFLNAEFWLYLIRENPNVC